MIRCVRRPPYQTRVAPSYAGPFINADLIQRDELRDASMQASYRAAEIAAERRASLLAARKSFATETVFSHPSKLEVITDAQTRGYMVIVMHVGVDSPDLFVARVRGRTLEGGHDVPEDKIRSHYDRGQPLIRQAVLRADRGMAFDNFPAQHPAAPHAHVRRRPPCPGGAGAAGLGSGRICR